VFLEAVPMAEACRLASKFFVCRRRKNAGILYVFQVFLAKADGKFAVKIHAVAIGTASYKMPVRRRGFHQLQTDLQWVIINSQEKTGGLMSV
jgi:hypothetical protein